MNQPSLFLLINVTGGIAVLGSYVVGLAYFPEYRNDLWGGIRGTWKPVLGISMLFATAGYLTFFYFAFFKGGEYFFKVNTFIGIPPATLLVTIFLISAAFWMPASIAYIHTENSSWWFVTVALLCITALSLTSLAGLVSFTSVNSIPITDWIACTTGLTLITAHCLFVDAIFWVVFFHR